jgi:hypothetical protein
MHYTCCSGANVRQQLLLRLRGSYQLQHIWCVQFGDMFSAVAVGGNGHRGDGSDSHLDLRSSSRQLLIHQTSIF